MEKPEFRTGPRGKHIAIRNYLASAADNLRRAHAIALDARNIQMAREIAFLTTATRELMDKCSTVQNPEEKAS